MNILCVLQQSVYNNNGKWSTADSNIQMMCGIFREFVNKTDWNFYVLIGKLDDFSDIKSYDEIFCHKNVSFIPYNFPVDAFFNRQHFNIFEFSEMWSKLPKIDIVWNNITEITRNIKTFLFYKKSNAKIISCCYWLDSPMIGEEKVDKIISYQWRQFDAFECADLVVFTCKSTKEAWVANSKYIFNAILIDNILIKSTIWDFGFSKNEAELYKTKNKFFKKTILFLNRLSGINYTHHEEFIVAVNELYEQRQDFQVVFTNPSGKFSWNELKQLVKPLFVYSENTLNREEYFKLLWMANTSVHLYEKERFGGCSHRESIYCGNITVTPKVFEYERIQGAFYPFYCSINSIFSIVKALNMSLNYTRKIYDKEILKRNNQSSFEEISDNVIKDIKRLS